MSAPLSTREAARKQEGPCVAAAIGSPHVMLAVEAGDEIVAAGKVLRPADLKSDVFDAVRLRMAVAAAIELQ